MACVLLALLAGATTAGCGSDCGAHCPTVEFNVIATPGEDLNVATASWKGDACATDAVPQCRGDVDGINLCVEFTIIGQRAGSCELDLTFTDGRLPFSTTATFGPATTQGCCQGFPVTSAPVVTVPPLHPLPDAGADVPASADAGSSD